MISIRALKMSDKQSLAKLVNNKKIWDNLRNGLPYPYHESDAVKFINTVCANELNHVFAIEYRHGFCGVIGIFVQQDVYEKSAEIGYWIGEPFWGKGIATKAVELVTKYAFDKLKLVRIFTGIFEYNTASMRVLEKNGYKKEAIFEKAVFKNGKIWNEHRYCKLNNSNLDEL